MENIFEQVENYLKEKEYDIEIKKSEGEYSIYFNIKVLDEDVLCVLEQDFENETGRFYFELYECEDDEEAFEIETFCNDFNNNATFLKSYIDEENVVCFEYFFIPNKDIMLELFESLLGDIELNEDTIATLFEE